MLLHMSYNQNMVAKSKTQGEKKDFIGGYLNKLDKGCNKMREGHDM
jgi:hypothetical protein